MKKHIISLVLFVSVVCIAPIYSLGRSRTTPATDTRNTGTGKSNGLKTQKLNRVRFWNTIVKALKKDGHAADSLEMQHAQRYLQRAQARQQNGAAGQKEQRSQSARARKNGSTLERRARTTENHRNRQTAASKKQSNRQTKQQPL